MANVGGLPGGMINPSSPGSGGIRPPVGDGAPVSRPGSPQAPQGIADGSLVEGLVTGRDGEAYLVRIGSQLLNARSTIPLFVGQRFRAVWDASTNPPMLRLQSGDMAVLARFTGRDQQIALALLSRGLPVQDEVIWGLRQQWMQNGGDPAKLGVLAELWARGAAMTEGNVALLAWYMELLPERVLEFWRKIRERLHARKFASPRELLDAVKGDEDDDDVKRFLQAHALAGKPARRGLDPALLLAPAWWPLDDEERGPILARVSFSADESNGRHVWWTAFELDGRAIGHTSGDVMTNGHALSVNIRLKDEGQIPFVQENLPALRQDLSEIPLALQHLGVGPYRNEDRGNESRQGLDMEV